MVAVPVFAAGCLMVTFLCRPPVPEAIGFEERQVRRSLNPFRTFVSGNVVPKV